VRVGETWLPRMQKLQANTVDGCENRPADVPLLKLFEFLTASM